jgi:hypothetical protein
MARLRSKHTFTLSKDTTETNQVFERVQREDEVSDVFVGAVSRVETVAAGGTLNLGGIGASKFVYVEAPAPVRVSLNGGAYLDVEPLTVGSATVPGRWYMTTKNVTSIAVNNPGVAAVLVTVVYAS